jgi:hypothetical protein
MTHRLADLHKAENALAQSEGDRQLSEEKFQKVFRSSPIPFSITTLKEGRFLDVMPRLSGGTAMRAKKRLATPSTN